MRRLHKLGIILALVTLMVLAQKSLIHCQYSATPGASISPKSESIGNSESGAVVGPHGYKVLIPEIKMNQLSGASMRNNRGSVPQQSNAPESAPDEIVKKEAPMQAFETPELPKAQENVEIQSRVDRDYDYNKLVKLFDMQDFSKKFLITVIIILCAGGALRPKNGVAVIKGKKGVPMAINYRKKEGLTIAGPSKTRGMVKEARGQQSQTPSPEVSVLPPTKHVQLRLPLSCYKKNPAIKASKSRRRLARNEISVVNPASDSKSG